MISQVIIYCTTLTPKQNQSLKKQKVRQKIQRFWKPRKQSNIIYDDMPDGRVQKIRNLKKWW